MYVLKVILCLVITDIDGNVNNVYIHYTLYIYIYIYIKIIKVSINYVICKYFKSTDVTFNSRLIFILLTDIGAANIM